MADSAVFPGPDRVLDPGPDPVGDVDVGGLPEPASGGRGPAAAIEDRITRMPIDVTTANISAMLAPCYG